MEQQVRRGMPCFKASGQGPVRGGGRDSGIHSAGAAAGWVATSGCSSRDAVKQRSGGRRVKRQEDQQGPVRGQGAAVQAGIQAASQRVRRRRAAWGHQHRAGRAGGAAVQRTGPALTLHSASAKRGQQFRPTFSASRRAHSDGAVRGSSGVRRPGAGPVSHREPGPAGRVSRRHGRAGIAEGRAIPGGGRQGQGGQGGALQMPGAGPAGVRGAGRPPRQGRRRAGVSTGAGEAWRASWQGGTIGLRTGVGQWPFQEQAAQCSGSEQASEARCQQKYISSRGAKQGLMSGQQQGCAEQPGQASQQGSGPAGERGVQGKRVQMWVSQAGFMRQGRAGPWAGQQEGRGAARQR
ncbi:hypothetical protein CesoFtcFv8_019274 [Champsocephalus esox]|uniref:Uncharacterized protein n=1 Tax=Champsocephalus esox TaxID=159716 RepID=A0AAN8GNB3_9TELE|nr:hypothetical protein CesoFtcFv8_019274 [Champsocephalus esox]